MSVSMLIPVLLKSDSGSDVLFADIASGLLYRSSGEEASQEESDAVFSEISGQQEYSMPKIPHEQIMNVLNTERGLSQENAKHIFRRNG